MDNKDDKRLQDERNIENNANNIRNAASVAMASGNPYAMAAGSAIKVGDKLTGGKVSEVGGRAMNTLNKHNPLGKQVQNASNKLSESGASDKVGAAARMKNGASSTGKAAGAADAASEKLKQNKANRGNNSPKKKSGGLLSRFSDSLGNSDESQDEENTTNDTDSETKEEIVGKLKIIKKVLIILAPLIPVILIVVIISSIISSVVGFFYWEADDSMGMDSELVSKFNDNEKKYYEKLDQVVKDYKNACGFEISKSYIHMVLIYKYENFDEFFEGNFEELTDEDLKQQNKNSVDYNELLKNVDTVAGLITSKSECSTPIYDIPEDVNNIPKGSFYGNLRNSSFVKSYFKDKLKDNTVDQLLLDIFMYGDFGYDEFEKTDDENVRLYIPDDLKVVSDNGSTTFDNYVEGELNGVLPDEILNTKSSNVVKAYTVALTTNTLVSNGYQVGDEEIKVLNNNTSYCDIKLGCYIDGTGRYITGGTESSSDKNKVYYNGLYYYKSPLVESTINNINSLYNDVKGVVILKDNSLYGVDISKLDGLTGDSYNSILTRAYPDIEIKSIKENDYISGVVFKDGQVFIDAIFYDQNNYNNVKFCGQKSDTIKTAGCGVTAMATVASTLLNSRDDKYAPVSMMNDAYKDGYCGPQGGGTNAEFFKVKARELNFNYSHASKNEGTKVINALLTGKSLVIVNVGKGEFTNGGHYMVIGGYDSTKKEFYIYDPNHSSNKKYRKLGNGWYGVDRIIKQTKSGFYIISKKS